MVRILVTGGTGLVGRAIKKVSISQDIIYLSSKDADLTDQEQVYKCFSLYKPEVIIHLAANVGGLFKNMNNKVEMYEKNMLINHNVLHVAHKLNIQKVVSCLSTCIFPDQIQYPIDETMLHLGAPHHSNDAYAYAKRMLEVQSRAYQENFGRDYVCIIPTNIYGEHDNFSLTDAHVIPALIHKCYLARLSDEDFVVCGSGKPLRQFIYSEDLARLILFVVESYKEKEPIILSVDEKDEVSIGDIAKMIAKTFEYEHRMVFDTEKPDGQYKKTASNGKLRKYLPDYKFVGLEKGIRQTVKWFIDHYDVARK